MDKEEYITEIKKNQEEDLWEKVIEQNYFLSKTATRKFEVLRCGFWFAGFGYIGLMVAGLFWILGS